MCQTPIRRKDDVETGVSQPLCPTIMLESPELQWGFIRKIYSILTIQLLITVAVVAVVVTVHPIAVFFSTTPAGLALYIILSFVIFIALRSLDYYSERRPWNYFLLLIFTVSLGFMLGLTCGFISGKEILESVILTTAAVLTLTMYTFWAAKRGHDYNFLEPFSSDAVFYLMIFPFIQIFGLDQLLFPMAMGQMSVMIYGCLASIIFCGCIIYETDNLIKRYSYHDEYIRASVSLYLDIIILLFSVMGIFDYFHSC